MQLHADECVLVLLGLHELPARRLKVVQIGRRHFSVREIRVISRSVYTNVIRKLMFDCLFFKFIFFSCIDHNRACFRKQHAYI